MRAATAAERLPGVRVLSTDELLAAEDIGTVLNLTPPSSHADVSARAIAEGKQVYVEKPVATDMESATRVLELAGLAGVAIGCAPDTVLGTGIQTSRRAIEAGVIGMPFAASATMAIDGHEAWHPNPDFYYQPGGGPLMDMGPYYVTALVHLLGPLVAVRGASLRPRSERLIATGRRAGELVPVAVDTHVTGILEHRGGAISTITMSFDTTYSASRNIEVHGDEGSLLVPDPNHFSGEVYCVARGDRDPKVLAASAGYAEASRGIGLIDMLSRQGGHGARASGRMAAHVLEVMSSVLASARTGDRVVLSTTIDPPPLVPLTRKRDW
jgi:predicted dehydrogenase